MSTENPIAETLLSIVNRKLEFKNYSLSSIDNSKKVDLLILDCQDLIDPAYRKWFIVRFYKLADDTVRRLAAQVRETKASKPDTNEQRLFSWLIKRQAGF